MKVMPVAGRAVRDPLLRDLVPPEGRTVPRDEYWLRRLRDGDVTEAPTDTPAAGTTEERA